MPNYHHIGGEEALSVLVRLEELSGDDPGEEAVAVNRSVGVLTLA